MYPPPIRHRSQGQARTNGDRAAEAEVFHSVGMDSQAAFRISGGFSIATMSWEMLSTSCTSRWTSFQL